jgi:hypothetical protein
MLDKVIKEKEIEEKKAQQLSNQIEKLNLIIKDAYDENE